MCNYLNNRKQRVVTNNSISTGKTVVVVVPRGSIYCLLLFSIFKNDFVLFIQYTILGNFADDSSTSISGSNGENLKSMLPSDFNTLNEWFHNNSLVIRQKGESQNGCFRKTRHAKFSEKRTFLTPWYARVHMKMEHWNLWIILGLCIIFIISCKCHCVKSVQYGVFFGPYFLVSGLNTEIYGSKSPYSVWIQEITDQKKNSYLDSLQHAVCIKWSILISLSISYWQFFVSTLSNEY